MNIAKYDTLDYDSKEIDVNALDSLTYEAWLNLKNIRGNSDEIKLSSEQNLILDELIASEQKKINDLFYLDNLGLQLNEVEENLQLTYNGKYKAANIWSYIFGIIMTTILFFPIFMVVGAIVGLEGIKVDFYFLIFVSVLFIIGATGVNLLTKVIERTRRRKNFKLSVSNLEFILCESKNKPVTFSKSEYKLDIDIEENTYYVRLKSDNDFKDVFKLSFSNIKSYNTLYLLINKLNLK